MLSSKLQAIKARALKEKGSLQQQRRQRLEQRLRGAVLSGRRLISLGLTRVSIGGVAGVLAGLVLYLLGWSHFLASTDLPWLGLLGVGGLMGLVPLAWMLARTRNRALRYSKSTTGIVSAARVVGRPGGGSDSGISYGIDALVQYETAGHMHQIKWYPRGSGNLHSSFKKKAERLLGSSLAVAYDPTSPDDAIIGNLDRARRVSRALYVWACVLYGFVLGLLGTSLLQ